MGRRTRGVEGTPIGMHEKPLWVPLSRAVQFSNAALGGFERVFFDGHVQLVTAIICRTFVTFDWHTRAGRLNVVCGSLAPPYPEPTR